MNPNPENIPSFVFELIQNYEFKSLSPSQQTEVLKHITQEEFDEIRTETLLLLSAKSSFTSPRQVAIKAELLETFDRHHATNESKILFFYSASFLWKVASAILLFTAGWLMNQWVPAKNNQSNLSNTKTDTFYITKEIEALPIKIYDTIFIQSEVKETIAKRITHPKPEPAANSDFTGGNFENSTQTFSLSELNSTPNQQKRNSIKEDSLLKKYSFNSM